MPRVKKRPLIAVLSLAMISFIIPVTAYSQGKDDSLKKAEALRVADSTKKAEAKKATDAVGEKSKTALPPVVRKVYNYNEDDTSNRNISSAGIGDIIVIEVDFLDSLLRKANSLDKNIGLYINGRRIDNVKPISGAPDKDKGTLQYRLDRNTQNDKIWADILGAPAIGENFFVESVKVSVGLENEFAIPTLSSDDNFNLIRIHKGWFWTCLFLVILYLLFVVTKAQKSGLLRDRNIDLRLLGIDNNRLFNPYSLGRVQMAFWFTLTILSFFFIWLITDAYDIITPTVLALIGISVGTSLSAAVIDDSKSTEVLNQTIVLQKELAGLLTGISNLQAQIASNPANVAELQNTLVTKQNREKEIKPIIDKNIQIITPQQSTGFFNDLLTDVNGVSFHRLQMLVWTFVLGLIFLYSVWKRLSMPEFSATLLALQGLTSGTYLGFKFPEKQS